jgi:DNA (cytosine-5)-methyltransferase 1
VHKNKFYIFKNKPKAVKETRATYSDLKSRKFISLFSGAMGLDLGLEQAGFEPAACLEIDKWACATIRKNRPDLPLIEDDIKNWAGNKILDFCKMPPSAVALIVGGPPCPSFSTAGKRKSFSDPRGEVMFDFLRVVNEIKPPFFVMENVRGILSSAIKHTPLEKRSKGQYWSEPDEKPGSVMRLLKDRFTEMGYTVTAELVNAANYGVPQVRERVVFIGSRDGYQIKMPLGGFAKEGNLIQNKWRTLKDALKGMDKVNHEYQKFSPARLKYLKLLKEGQNWRDLPQELIPEALGGAFGSDGGKVGFYRRLAWGKPAPTVPTSPVQKSTCICHPEQLRPLSVQEYARVQQFPEDWKLVGSTTEKYKQVGNAVPVGLGYAIGKTILSYLENLEEAY